MNEPTRNDDTTLTPDLRRQRDERLIPQLVRDGVTDESVLEAIRRVPRHLLIPEHSRPFSYENRALGIAEGQTISQPTIVGLMTQYAARGGRKKVLEIGTGSGYQAAVLSLLFEQVYTIEAIEVLGRAGRRALEQIGFDDNIHFRIGDGSLGWLEAAPFDAIVVTAAAPRIPDALKEQLELGGHLVIPVGEYVQTLRVMQKGEQAWQLLGEIPVRFVPMTGAVREQQPLP